MGRGTSKRNEVKSNICPHVMHVVVKTVHFVRKQGLNHRQFQPLALEMDVEYGDLLYCCEVRWLSRGAMLHGVYVNRNELPAFVAQKGLAVPQDGCQI